MNLQCMLWIAFLLLVASRSLAEPLPPEALAVTEADVLSALDLNRPGLGSAKAAAAQDDLTKASVAWAEYFRTREKPVLHFSRETWAQVIRRDYAQLVGPMLAEADQIARHELQGSTISLKVQGDEIDWLSNPTKDTNYVELVGNYVRLTNLGRAYLLTGDEKYARAFVWYFDSWFEHREAIEKHRGGLGFSPIYYAYYPGIRARLLLDNYYCLARSPALTPAIQMKLMRELLGAARWIHRRHAAYQGGNQQVATVLGAAAVGLFLPEFKESAAWVERATARLVEHLERDFHPDGGHRELCDQYHMTVLRDIGYVALMQSRNGQPSLLQGENGKRFARSVGWLAKLVIPTGHVPPLHSGVFNREWLVPVTLGARYFQRPDWWWLAEREWSKGALPVQKGPMGWAVYLINEDFSRTLPRDVVPSKPAFEGFHLETSGYAVMRTGWQTDDRYLVFQYGWASSGHAYPGALSCLLAMNGEVIATNPGSPRSYRHPAYAYCCSTRSHNVVSIDNVSYTPKSGIAPGGKLESLADLPGAWYVRARHEGYLPAFDAVHRREILVI